MTQNKGLLVALTISFPIGWYVFARTSTGNYFPVIEDCLVLWNTSKPFNQRHAANSLVIMDHANLGSVVNNVTIKAISELSSLTNSV